METIVKRIKNKFINYNDYEYSIYHNLPLKLSDHVILYNINDQWKLFKIDIALSYPIIYDKDDEGIVTLVICPITLRSAIFEGEYEFDNYNEYNMILKNKSTQKLTSLIPLVRDEKMYEIKILTLRSALITAPDVKYMIHLNSKYNIDPIIKPGYYSNMLDVDNYEMNDLIHPKTLVYIIQYKSNFDDSGNGGNDDLHTIILGKDIVKDLVTGYDTRKSGLFDYLAKNSRKIIEKEGFIFPMLWYLARKMYKKSKVVYITK